MRLLSRNISGVLFFVVLAGMTAFAAENEPPAVIAALAGEWSGESHRSVTGVAGGSAHRDARQYWIEGEIVRGEILSGAGGSLALYEVTIVPRDGRFLKILQPENGERRLFVGLAAEGGVMWSAVDTDGALFIERVVGSGQERRLELLVPENGGGSWQVAESLEPAEAVLSGVIGGSSRAVGQIKPLILPPAEELELVDRIAMLLEQRDAARKNGDSLALELANAWRVGEEAAARVRELEQQIESVAPADDPELGAASESESAKVVAASELSEAQAWADQLEQSLEVTNQRADQAAARSAELEQQLSAAREALERAQEESAQLNAALAEERTHAERATARVAELEAQAAAREQQVAEAARAEELDRELAVKESALEETRSELEKLRAEVAATASRLAESQAQNGTLAAELRELQAKMAATEGEGDELEATLAAAQERAEAAEVLADDLKRQTEVVAARDQRIAELEASLQNAETARDAADENRQSLETRIATLDKENAGLRERTDAVASQARDASSWAAAELDQLRSLLSELEGAKAASDAGAVQLRGELEQLQASNGELQAELRALNEETDHNRTLLDEREQRIIELTRALQETRGEATTLAAALSQASAQIDESVSKVAGATGATADLRVAELETRLADTFARAERRQTEIERLTERVSELEAERRVLQERVTDLAAQTPLLPELVPERVVELREDPVVDTTPVQPAARVAPPTVAERAIPVVTPRPVESPRRAPTAPTRPAVNVPDPTVPIARDSVPLAAVQFRLPPSAPLSGPRVPPTRPEESINYPAPSPPGTGATIRGPSGVNSFLAQVVRSLSINGYRGQGTQGTIVIAGRLYQSGETIANGRGLQFTRIDPDAIIFTDSSGGEYRYSL